ncbi:MAG: hypothetical protein IT380_10110 [Myxococcales bacterium]|nr:hypothetical protein [Myxococcales bacterium]
MNPYYELFVNDADGREWYDSAIVEYLPKGQRSWSGLIFGVANTRKQALAARKKLLKDHPTALVRIFEVDPKLDEVDPRPESRFDLDTDGVFVAKRQRRARGTPRGGSAARRRSC